MKLTKVRVLLMLILVITSSSLIVWHFTSATPSPAINRVVTPGAIGPCSWFISLDGTTPVAEAMIGGLSVAPGDNIVGTAGQDMTTFLNTLLSAGGTFCFSGQIFTFLSGLTIYTNDVLIGSGRSNTIFQGSFASTQGLIQNNNHGSATPLTVFDSNIYIGHLTIDCNSIVSRRLYDGITFAAVQHVLLEDNAYKNCYQYNLLFIQAGGGAVISSFDVKIIGGICYGLPTDHQTGFPACTTNFVDGVTVDRMTFYPTTSDATSPEFFPDDSRDITISNGLFMGPSSGAPSHGLWMSSDSATQAINNTAVTNSIFNNTDLTLDFNVQSVTASNLEFMSPQTASGTAISDTGHSGKDNLKFSNVQIFGYSTGVNLQIATWTLDNVAIKNCGAFGGLRFDHNLTAFIGTNIYTTGCSGKGIEFGSNVKTGTYQLFDSDFNDGVAGTFQGRGLWTIRNVIGINPLGKIGTAFANTPNFVGLGGTTATPTAASTYIVTGVDCFFTWTGGTVSVQITDQNNAVLESGIATTPQPILVPVGYGITFVTFSGGPTVLVFGN